MNYLFEFSLKVQLITTKVTSTNVDNIYVIIIPVSQSPVYSHWPCRSGSLYMGKVTWDFYNYIAKAYTAKEACKVLHNNHGNKDGNKLEMVMMATEILILLRLNNNKEEEDAGDFVKVEVKDEEETFWLIQWWWKRRTDRDRERERENEYVYQDVRREEVSFLGKCFNNFSWQFFSSFCAFFHSLSQTDVSDLLCLLDEPIYGREEREKKFTLVSILFNFIIE